MVKLPVDMSRFLPINRETAMRLAAVAGRSQCTLTLEASGVVLNLKSTIGLLSQTIPQNGQMTLVADGPDEVAAAAGMKAVIEGRAC